MPCFKPMRVALTDDGHLDWQIYDPPEDLYDIVLVPCRKCAGCRYAQAREWSIRCYHELFSYERSWRDPDSGVTTRIPHACMLTLTYDNDHLPDDRRLNHRHFQLFIKRVRHLSKRDRLAFFMCGEYGGKTGRPHYHCILYGEDFEDRYSVTTSDGQVLNCSFELDKAWRQGRATIDEVNFNTIRYVCGYLSKENHINGNFTGPITEMLDEQTGELIVKFPEPEYRTMSKRPGLGRNWIEANFESVYPHDCIEIGGHSYPPPTFYDLWLKRNHRDLYYEVQSTRRLQRVQAQKDWTPKRISAAEAIYVSGEKQRKDRN